MYLCRDRSPERAGCDVHCARELLERGNASAEETAGQRACGVSVDAQRTGDLLEKAGIDVLRENLRRLIGGLGHGGKKDFAVALGVSPVAVSRWLSGRHRPRKSRLSAIARYFGLTPDVDLETFPVFLSGPVTDDERRTSSGTTKTDGESMRIISRPR
jgi:transcriptional regulator with XRE-family HTH domain